MNPATKKEFITRWLPHFTPGLRNYLQQHLGRDTGVFTSGTFHDERGRGCLAELAGRFHPRIGSSKFAGVQFMRLIGVEVDDSLVLQEWDQRRSDQERRRFEHEIRSLVVSRSHSDSHKGSATYGECEQLGASMAAGGISIVAGFVSVVVEGLGLLLRTVAEDIETGVEQFALRCYAGERANSSPQHDADSTPRVESCQQMTGALLDCKRNISGAAIASVHQSAMRRPRPSVHHNEWLRQGSEHAPNDDRKDQQRLNHAWPERPRDAGERVSSQDTNGRGAGPQRRQNESAGRRRRNVPVGS